MKKQFLFILILFSHLVCSSQEDSIPSPSSFFPTERAQILLVGTFHFHYPGLDVNQTSEEDKIDVLKEPKKSEVTQVVEYIKKFKPNKIALEATDNWEAFHKFQQYQKGQYINERDERFQLGFRIANDLDLDTVFSIDAHSYADDLNNSDPSKVKELFNGYDFKNEDPYMVYVGNWDRHEDSLQKELNLLDYLKYTNSSEVHRLVYGRYLIGDFKLEDHRGADVLSLWWYNRNLRIFRRIQDLAQEGDRILVIVGNGHAAILRNLVESTPEFDLVEFGSL